MNTGSPAEYARHRGVSKAAVSKAIQERRLVESITAGESGKVTVDFERADAEWAKNTRYARSLQDPGPSAEIEAEVRLKVARAELAETKLARERGDLVDAAEVEREWFDRTTKVRTRLLAVTSRVRQQAPDLQAATITLIDGLIREALEELVEEGDKP